MPRRKPRKLPVWLSADESAKLLEAARAQAEAAQAPSRKRAAQRNHLLVMCGLYLGMRVAELVHLRVEHIDWGSGQVLVYQGKGSKDRLLPLRADLGEAIRGWIGERREGWVFPGEVDGKPISVRTVQAMIKRLGRAAGLTKAALLTPHKLRHTFGSRLVQTGADIVSVRDLLGHSSINTTQVYLHADQQRFRAAVDRL